MLFYVMTPFEEHIPFLHFLRLVTRALARFGSSQLVDALGLGLLGVGFGLVKALAILSHLTVKVGHSSQWGLRV